MENKMKFVKATNINVSIQKRCKHGKIRISDQNIGYKMLYKMGWDIDLYFIIDLIIK